MDEGAAPAVSVIIPAYRSQATVASCLESLRRQSFTDFETILVDSTPDPETASLVRARFPEVRLHHHPQRLLPHAARNQGARMARGHILVFTDPDCEMRPDWLERLVRAHEAGRPAVGGGVANASGGWFARAVHMAKYAWWLPGGEPGWRPDIPSANASYSRALWERIGPFRGDCFCGDTLLSSSLAATGARPWFDPRAIVAHHHRCGWREFLAERWSRGYDYGATRPRVEHWSRLRIAIYVAASPLVPVVMTWRALRFALRSGHAGAMLLAAPVVMCGYATRAIGEAAGHARLLLDTTPRQAPR
jgi:glycosyltransferase involved in cell wall biosynthesis